MSLFGAWQDVKDFHAATDAPILMKPEIPPDDRIKLRLSLINEEVNEELIPAIRALMDNWNSDPDDAAKKLAAVADGAIDSIYVILGLLIESGIPADKVWLLVQRANMAKVDPVTGKVRRREDGKILKPDGWTAPDAAILSVIRETMG